MAKKECLPSGDAAIDLFRAPTALNVGKVFGTFVVRGLLIGAGVYVAGARGKPWLWYTLGAAGAVEVGVLAWAWWAAAGGRQMLAAREAPRRNPLRRGRSDATFRHNIRVERRRGVPEKQAVAIAYKKRRESGWRG